MGALGPFEAGGFASAAFFSGLAGSLDSFFSGSFFSGLAGSLDSFFSGSFFSGFFFSGFFFSGFFSSFFLPASALDLFAFSSALYFPAALLYFSTSFQ